MANALLINSVEEFEQALPIIRAAQEEYATFTQEQVDTICEKAAMAVSKMRIPLAKMACEETGYGIVVDKVTKNQYASEHMWNYMRHAKTCGIIEENRAFGTKRVASPKGVIAAVTPTTNPTSTTIFKMLVALKTRNAIILSPHPHAVKCSIAAAKIIRDAAIEAGLPEHVISWIGTPSLEISDILMKKVDLIMATGGAGMVHAAYSSGTPAIGVGPGNCNVVIDETADLRMAVESIIHSKTFDNGMICATEQHITVLSSVYDEVKALLKDARCYFLNDEEAAKVAKVFYNPKNHGVNPPAVGQTAVRLAEMAGIQVPYDSKVLIYESNDTSHENPWANEKLTTLLGMFKADTLDEAFDICAKLVYEGGAGHSAALYIDPTEEKKIDRFAEKMKAGRILINTPTAFGGIGDLYNFDIAPSLTLGPGSVGHSAYMGNTNFEQLLDIKVVANRKENMLWLQLPKKVYHKTGCTPVALREMKHVYDFKRAFIITDANLYQMGACDAILNQLHDLGIETAEFFDIQVDPQIQDAMKGLPKMHEFEPDVIIAVGGGSAIDTAKIMWIMYEHPEEAFLDMATIFLDIRKRVRFFPQMGEKAKLVCIPTTAGTGSECTPFTIISDANTGMKWPLVGYEMMPEMAIIDAENMMALPPRATQASGYDVLTHAVEAYVSTFATEYTDGFCRDATTMVFNYLPRAYRSAFKGAKADPVAREKMADASCLAGIGFANAFLGINHSLSHKIGGWFHIPHGTANALLFPYVCRFNAQKHPYHMGTFSQYKYPQAFERYVQLGELIGVKGATDEETFENWIKAAEQLKKDVDIPETICDWLVEAHPEKKAKAWEADFLAAVDQMSEWAFHDACTGCNPVYPTIEELKACYLRAFYGNDKFIEKFGDVLAVAVTLPLDTHAAYPMGLSAEIGVDKVGGFI
ncbi:bifunctional acetaldehyde-CoA/alcohol dehydrogenase [Oscillibacter sp.]|uniref:bifunctional acetaldehyde-CoA/alcohol dehydrogenase n=1 Tax=Oscillibacter sp. TaxID=1945593 RepID=UPI0028A07F48|nr:bifunctional acetaldehyde-CoA/alcohol dehydrogenase [Oscillibacter sp.]